MYTGLQRYRYYDLFKKVSHNRVDIDEAAHTVRELIVNSVKLHMRSDVPVGLALSGGLDSTSMLASLNISNSLSDQLECLSFEFENSLSEAKWIKLAASHYGLKSRFEVFTKNDFYNSIKPLMWHLEGPIGGLAMCALAKLMSRANKMGFKVIQDGTGLDEAFGGYKNHHNLFLGSKIQDLDPLSNKYLKEYANFWGVTENEARNSAIKEVNNSVTSIDGTIPVRPDLLKPEFIKNYPGEIDRVQQINSKFYNGLVDYLQIRKVPRNTRDER